VEKRPRLFSVTESAGKKDSTYGIIQKFKHQFCQRSISRDFNLAAQPYQQARTPFGQIGDA
jgi:hypothetical protein